LKFFGFKRRSIIILHIDIVTILLTQLLLKDEHN
jgi:hypothetical protein